MKSNMQISFGDNVKVRELPTTKAEGVAGLIGNVRGETTPSVTNVHVIGDLKEDYALNVYFEDRDECFWFTPDQLDFIDHAVGTEITLNLIHRARDPRAGELPVMRKKMNDLTNHLRMIS